MKTGLLMSVVMVGGMVGAVTNVRAACIPTNDCAELGYKYSATDCSGEGLACPFDTTRYNCANPCSYSITASTCSSQCLNVGAKSCTRGGVTYYESCGASKCSSGQTCENGTCQSNTSETDFYCCDDVRYGCSSYYSTCKSRTSWGDCSDVVRSYERQGCSPVFQRCGCLVGDYAYGNYGAKFRCE